MKTLLEWVKVILVVMAIIMAFIFFERRGKKDPLKLALREIEAQVAAGEMRKTIARAGHKAAVEAIMVDYTKQFDELNAAARKKAAELKEDPVELARFLVKVAA